MKYCSVLILILISLYTSAQTLPDVVNFKTPEAAAFDKYIETPVSYYTGVPSISIPLYTINIKGVSVPITLNYHAGGIRVDEEASWVGLGWSLDYGGQVSRKVRGQRDENAFFKTDASGNPNNSIAYFMQLPDISQDPYVANRKQMMWDLKQKQDGCADYLPDEFYYSILGYSGRFMFNQANRKFVFFPRQDITANYDVSNLNSGGFSTPDYHITDFNLTLPNGVAVNFGQDAFSEQKTTTMNFYDRNCWRVKSITNTNNESIAYSYSEESYSSVRLGGEIYSAWNKTTNATVNTQQYNDARLYHIDFPNGYIVFYAGSRDDMPNSMLSKIEVYDLGGHLLKSVDFSYSYFTGTYASSPRLSYVSDNYNNKRLRLDNVSIYNYNLSPLQYTFDYYYGTNAPSKTSYAQDYWGFYNGVTNNTLVPLLSTTAQPTGGADRNAYENVSSMFALKSIVYPTGGKIEYIYEGNKVANNPALYNGNVGGLRIKNINLYGSDGAVISKKQYSYLDPYGASSGMAISWPKQYQFTFHEIVSGTDGSHNDMADMKFYGNSVAPMETTSGSYVGYEYVTEQTIGATPDDLLTTKYRFSVLRPYYDQNYITTNEGVIDAQEWKRGKLLSAQYMKNNKAIKTELYQYYQFSPHLATSTNEDYVDEINQDYISYHVIPLAFDTPEDFYDPTVVAFDYAIGPVGANGTPFDSRMGWIYGVSQQGSTGAHPLSFPYFQRFTGFDQLQSKTTITYDDAGNSLSETENNYYEKTPQLYQLTKSQHLNSKGESLEKSLKYPLDFSSTAPYSTMIQRNIVNPVIMQTDTKNSSFLQSSKMNYQDWGNNIIAPVSLESTVSTFPTETRVRYFGYDAKGNPLSVAKTNDVKETYLWGYNNTYPVAKIVGADYSTAIGFVNQTILQSPASDQQLRDEINKVRTGLASTAAFVSAYTYAPLVGITSQTDAANKTSYYEYDGLSRLKLIRDFNNNIVKRYDYQYQTNGNVTYYYNHVQSVVYMKNNCQVTEQGGSYSTTVAANTYFSTVSQAAADQLATDYTNTNGQPNANANGTCTAVSGVISLGYYVSRGIPFLFVFTNLSTNQVYRGMTSGMSGTMGSIPPGNYSLQVTCPKLNGGTTFSYSMTGYSQSNATAISIPSITINSTVNIQVF